MKIIVLCTYPVAEPRHGGQIRVKNMIDYYRAAGHNVTAIGVLGSDSYTREDGFLPFPGYNVLKEIYAQPFLMEDYALGELFFHNTKYHEKLKKLIHFDAQIVHVEQPWLFRFIQKVIEEEKDWQPILIYSSHNIEYQLKREILSSYVSEQQALDAAKLIHQLEINAVKRADGVIYVSESDGEILKKYEPKAMELARNGVTDWSRNQLPNGLHKESYKSIQFALYCASSHPPNISGFFDMFGGGFGSLNPEQKLIIAGGAGYAIANDRRVYESAKLGEKIIIAGSVGQNTLNDLINSAHCLVLPVTQGGGTNLKTAEALWSGQYVLATPVAMRGFEKFISSPGVFIENTPGQFKRKLRDIMSMPSFRLTHDELQKRSTVLWDNCFSRLSIFIEKLINKVPYE